MRKGEATGPQKRARRETPAAKPADQPEAAEDEALDGDQEVVRGDDRARARQAWDATLDRIHAEAERVLTAADRLPASQVLRKPEEAPLHTLHDFEADLTKLRVRLEQATDAVL